MKFNLASQFRPLLMLLFIQYEIFWFLVWQMILHRNCDIFMLWDWILFMSLIYLFIDSMGMEYRACACWASTYHRATSPSVSVLVGFCETTLIGARGKKAQPLCYPVGAEIPHSSLWHHRGPSGMLGGGEYQIPCDPAAGLASLAAKAILPVRSLETTLAGRGGPPQHGQTGVHVQVLKQSQRTPEVWVGSFFFFFLFWDRVLLHGPGWPWICDLSWVLGSQVYDTTPSETAFSESQLPTWAFPIPPFGGGCWNASFQPGLVGVRPQDFLGCLAAAEQLLSESFLSCCVVCSWSFAWREVFYQTSLFVSVGVSGLFTSQTSSMEYMRPKETKVTTMSLFRS
jgi:hypothetical protein